MNSDNPEKKLKELLEKQNLCTLSTVTPRGKPEAATIQYVHDEEFNLYFETFPSKSFEFKCVMRNKIQFPAFPSY